MSIEVRIPTILRPFTKDQKAVTADGSSLSALITDLDAQYPGIGDRLLENGALRRFINIYINDEDQQKYYLVDSIEEYKDVETLCQINLLLIQ